MSPTTTYVYWHLNANDEVLYVGRSASPPNRMAGHMANSPWWHLVEQIVVDGPFEMRAGTAYEGRLIAESDPPYNVTGTSKDLRPVAVLNRRTLLSQPLVRPAVVEVANGNPPMILEPESSIATLLWRAS